MIKKLLLIFALAQLLLAQTTPQTSSYPAIAYVVKEVGAKDILMSKNQNQRIAPASLTKVMTTTLALEISDPNAEVIIPKEATLVEPSKAGFKVGEVFTMRDLIEAALVHSANDAAYSIAYHIGGGDINKFVALMNAKAQSLGMTNTHFTNPAGFDIGEHYSTAADLLKLAEYAIKNRSFNEIVQKHTTTITSINTGAIYRMKTSNKLLDQYPYAVGIKTGYTKKAGPCLIARAKKDNKDVIVVLLKSKVSRWGMVENIFEKAYIMNEPEMEAHEEVAPGASYQQMAKKGHKSIKSTQTSNIRKKPSSQAKHLAKKPLKQRIAKQRNQEQNNN